MDPDDEGQCCENATGPGDDGMCAECVAFVEAMAADR